MKKSALPAPTLPQPCYQARMSFPFNLLCGYLLKILSLYLGSAIQVLKEWNMTGKKKVRLRVTLN
jgi:hypothetical protein